MPRTTKQEEQPMDRILIADCNQSFMRKGKFRGIQGGDPWLQIVINENDQDTYMPSFDINDYEQVHVISLSSMPTQMPHAMKMVLEQLEAKKANHVTNGKIVPNIRLSFRFDETSPLKQIKHLDQVMGFETCDHDDVREEYASSGEDDELDFLMCVYDDKKVCGILRGMEFNFAVPYTKHDREWHNDLMSYYPSSQPNQDQDEFYRREFHPLRGTCGTYAVQEELADGTIEVHEEYDWVDEEKLGDIGSDGREDEEEDEVCSSVKRPRRDM